MRLSPLSLRDYEAVIGPGAIAELNLLADKLRGKVVQIVNSTFQGGGVAEILNRMVPLFTELGVDARWDVFRGDAAFFEVTKKIHNALHGRQESLGEPDLALFWETSRTNLKQLSFYGDIFFIHDPQPIALVQKKREVGKRWIWRCHVDVSSPQPEVWAFLQQFLHDYDAAVFHSPAFSHPLPLRQFLIPPSIDPLSEKNRELPQEEVERVLARFKIDGDKPLITQISRFDQLKDPLGVIQAFNLVRRNFDCQLLLAGGSASDDPEGEAVLAQVQERAADDPDIHVLLLPPDSHLEINALQRASTVIVQKSLREGFGLTVSEALWKSKPVVASAVGGIPLQIEHRLTGLLSYSIEGTAYGIRQVLSNPDYGRWLGENGREHVRQNFLITRHLRDYLLLFLALDSLGDMVYLS